MTEPSLAPATSPAGPADAHPGPHGAPAETEALLRTALHAAGIGLWCWDCESDRFAPSETLRALFGFPPGGPPVGYRDLQARVHPADREILDSAIRRALRHGAEHQLDYRVVLPDGTLRWLSNRAQVERDPARGRALRMIGIAMDITERKRSEERVAHLAHHDALTGLPNRLLLRDRIARAVAQARRRRARMAVLFIDLDDFKSVNDSLGHDAGDGVLKAVATSILACVREGDTVARVGGDEFVIVIPEVGERAGVSSVAAKVLDALGCAFPLPGASSGIAASIGISTHPEDGDDAEALLRSADAAMYRAKDEGGRCVRFSGQR